MCQFLISNLFPRDEVGMKSNRWKEESLLILPDFSVELTQLTADPPVQLPVTNT